MSVSSVQSNCGSSDFSIERILSEESRTTEKCTKSPSWLCCTRYKPPRIPRASSATRARRSGRHARVPFTSAQAAALEAAYARAPYLAPPALRALAAALQLRDDRIKIWFQNRRARERREKCDTIKPPHAMTLPSSIGGQRNASNSSWATCQNQDDYFMTNRGEQSKTVPGNQFMEIITNSSYDWQSICPSEDSNESPLDVETVD